MYVGQGVGVDGVAEASLAHPMERGRNQWSLKINHLAISATDFPSGSTHSVRAIRQNPLFDRRLPRSTLRRTEELAFRLIPDPNQGVMQGHALEIFFHLLDLARLIDLYSVEGWAYGGDLAGRV